MSHCCVCFLPGKVLNHALKVFYYSDTVVKLSSSFTYKYVKGRYFLCLCYFPPKKSSSFSVRALESPGF